jgi:hypothetical protein
MYNVFGEKPGLVIREEDSMGQTKKKIIINKIKICRMCGTQKTS